MSCSAPGITTTSASGFARFHVPTLSGTGDHESRSPKKRRAGTRTRREDRLRVEVHLLDPETLTLVVERGRREPEEAEPFLVERGHQIGAQGLLVDGTIVDGVLEALPKVECAGDGVRRRSRQAAAGALSRTSSARTA